MKQISEDQKKDITREVNRIFNEKFEKAGDFKTHVRRMVTYRLEDLKREVVRGALRRKTTRGRSTYRS